MSVTFGVWPTFQSLPKPRRGPYPDGLWGGRCLEAHDASGGTAFGQVVIPIKDQESKWIWLDKMSLRIAGIVQQVDLFFMHNYMPGSRGSSGQTNPPILYYTIALTQMVDAAYYSLPLTQALHLRGWLATGLPLTPVFNNDIPFMFRTLNVAAATTDFNIYGWWWDKTRLEREGLTPQVPGL